MNIAKIALTTPKKSKTKRMKMSMVAKAILTPKKNWVTVLMTVARRASLMSNLDMS